MDRVINFLNEYGVISAIITAAAAALGKLLKTLYDRTLGTYFKDKIKREVAAQVVKYVEQVYKDLHGEEKLEAAIDAAAEMLNEKGITISDLELRVLIEAAVAEFNEAFKKIEVAEAQDLEELLGAETVELIASIEAENAAGK
jgi:hypothetical protein